MRYKIRVFAGSRHPLKIPFGTHLKDFEVSGEDARKHEVGILTNYIASGHVSRVDILDRNNTLVDQISG